MQDNDMEPKLELEEASADSSQPIAGDDFADGEPLTLELESGIEFEGRDVGEKSGLMRWDEALTFEGQIEAILFASPKPLSFSEIAEILSEDGVGPVLADVEAVVSNLQRLYRERNGGFRLEHEKGVGYQFRTVPAAAILMEKMFATRQRPLSRAALETLAIIAYRQPVTRADIEYIRGVDAGSIIKNLLDRDLIECVGRKDDAGRPMMFGTTSEFLKVFRLNTLKDLPPLVAFQPAPDMMSEALDKLEHRNDDVDVDQFMDDPDRDLPDVSGGLATTEFFDDRIDLELDKSSQLREDEEPRRVGASYKAEGTEGDD